MPLHSIRRPASRLAMAIALTTGAAFGLTATATPAFAAKKKEKESAPKANYSKEFVGAYQPFAQKLQDDSTDIATLQAELPQVVAMAKTPDDNFVAGQITYSIGTKAKDLATQRKGLDMMLDSGKTPAESLATNLFAASQLAYQAKDWNAAISRAQQSIDAGNNKGDPELLIAESWFAQKQPQKGIDALELAISKKQQAGEAVPEAWIKRAVAMSYEGDLKESALKYAGLYAELFPSVNSWGDAIAIERNFYDFEGQSLLDLMRLSMRTNSLRNSRDYVEYFTAADARRLPGETLKVIDAGIAAGQLSASDVTVSEAKSIATSRLSADKSSLPSLASDADKAGASLATINAAGDAFLSYGEAAKAEGYYKRALDKPGVDTPRVLTRLGIALADQGKYAEAQQTFAKVQGERQPIAYLWSIYAKQKAGGATAGNSQ